MSKKLNLNNIRKWKDLRKFADENGLPVIRKNGGHEIRGNKKGIMVFSIHEKEPSSELLHRVRKQIKFLLGMSVVLFFVIYTISNIT